MDRQKRIYPVVKRLLDFLGASILLILVSPLLAITAICVRVNLGKPVIFSQLRPGLNEKIFKLYKFRSMKNENPELGLISDEERLTKFGKLLRSTSLDELPSLWNVIKGEMSFVGPRPLLVSYLAHYDEQQSRRHNVRPGITGLAQISGRNSISWKEKFEFDICYVDTCSFGLDCLILWKTLRTIIDRRGISANGHVSMPSFIDEI